MFQLDAAGNERYKRECTYDPDMYESEWLNPRTHLKGVAYQGGFYKLLKEKKSNIIQAQNSLHSSIIVFDFLNLRIVSRNGSSKCAS